MVEIREVDGRFEVYAPGYHWEVFLQRHTAELVAAELARKIAKEIEMRSNKA